MIFKSVQRDRQDHINGIAMTMTLCLPATAGFLFTMEGEAYETEISAYG